MRRWSRGTTLASAWTEGAAATEGSRVRHRVRAPCRTRLPRLLNSPSF